MATPDPYQYWSGAPKHWGHVPGQRSCPPEPEQLEDLTPHWRVWAAVTSRQGGEWTVASVALAVAVAAFILVGTGGEAADQDPPPPERPGGVLVR